MKLGKKEGLGLSALVLAAGVTLASTTADTHSATPEGGNSAEAEHADTIMQAVRNEMGHTLGGLINGLKTDESLGEYIKIILAGYQQNPPRPTTY